MCVCVYVLRKKKKSSFYLVTGLMLITKPNCFPVGYKKSHRTLISDKVTLRPK